METIAQLVRDIAVLVLLFAFLELLLPEGRLSRFIRLALSLLLVASIMGPLMELAGKDGETLLPEIVPEAADSTQDYTEQGQRIAGSLAADAEQQYAEGLARQMAALARLQPGVGKAAARVEATENGALTGAELYLLPEEGAAEDLTDQVGDFISNYYGLSREAVQCFLATEMEEGAEDGG